MPSAQKTKRRLAIWLLPAFSVVLFFGATEGIIRALGLARALDADFRFFVQRVDNDVEERFNQADAALMWRPRPGYQDARITISSQGFRDREYAATKPEGTRRILALGDSSTFGHDVALEDTWHAILEKRLERRLQRRPGDRWEVINAGVTGYTSSLALRMYREHGRSLDPDIVVLYIGLNDVIAKYHLSDDAILARSGPDLARRLQNSVLLHLHTWLLIKRGVNAISSWVEGDAARAPVARVSEEQYLQNLRALARETTTDGARLVLISSPVCKEWTAGLHDAEGVYRRRALLHEEAARLDVPLLYVRRLTEAAETFNAALFLDSVHPNPRGHGLLAERLHELLESENLLSSEPAP
ncbi:MAG: lysophospholipase L1-like esterase [Myxococcota bacterium]|jgi:lysophospholipase L1-like esterase